MRASGARYGLGHVQSRLCPHLRHATSTRRRIGSMTPTLHCSKARPTVSVCCECDTFLYAARVQKNAQFHFMAGHFGTASVGWTETCAVGTGYSGVRREAAPTQLQNSTARPAHQHIGIVSKPLETRALWKADTDPDPQAPAARTAPCAGQPQAPEANLPDLIRVLDGSIQCDDLYRSVAVYALQGQSRGCWHVPLHAE
ncbi:hypothetical protein C8Q76DRAFT_788975 [Earliella scabrosa]|nr:hypothetical protein C8Q76DRAFT_788975 [Earliella scabrosa]